MLKAYDRAKSGDETLHAELLKLRGQTLDLKQQFGGSKARSEVGEYTLQGHDRKAKDH